MDDGVDALDRRLERIGIGEVAADGGRAGREGDVAADECAAVEAGLGEARQQARADEAGRVGERLAPYGISGRELAVLLLLDAREPESQQQAGTRLGVDRTTMVALIDSLEKKRLVVRRPDAADRRRNVIALTASGRKTLRQATRASDHAEQRLLAELDEAESAQLRGLLRRIAVPRRDR